jgi:hypothetical protein
VAFINNSDHNVVQNLIVIGDDIDRLSSGIIFGSRDNSHFAPDSNLIQKNLIKKGGGAIDITAQNAFTNVRAIGNIIRENKIGTESNSTLAWGIWTEKTSYTIVEGNHAHTGITFASFVIILYTTFLENKVTLSVEFY